jgi:uncharacterized protein YbaR (Trm112 family)/ubiquinone/menaquinone biosynthesis C-methylase UbiE
MREDVLQYILCPHCRSPRFDLTIAEKDEREIREGKLSCPACNHHYPIHKGILNLLLNPSSAIQSEQKGWVEMLGETSEELVETMLQLPYYKDDIWVTTAENYDQIMAQVDLTGKRVLDIGAGRCWSTRRMMMAGASRAVAVDILEARFIGLETADIFLQHDGIYFERIMADMNDLPLCPASFDVVFMTSTLHHSSDPAECMRQVAKSLVPGGLAIVINEPIRSLFRSSNLSNCPEIAHGINENVYTIIEYLTAIRRAGLQPRLFFPRSISQGLEKNKPATKQEMGTIGHYVAAHLWQRKRGRQLMNGPFLPAICLIASMPLVMMAHKP